MHHLIVDDACVGVVDSPMSAYQQLWILILAKIRSAGLKEASEFGIGVDDVWDTWEDGSDLHHSGDNGKNINPWQDQNVRFGQRNRVQAT